VSATEERETRERKAAPPAVRAPGEVWDVARAQWDAYNRKLIRDLVPSDATDAQFEAFLELAARYGLDPIRKEIHLAVLAGENGGKGTIVPIIARDAWLKIADRHPAFESMDSDAVYSNDSFRKLKDGTIEHEYGNPAERGKLVAGYCVVVRSDRKKPYRFVANLVDYQKASGKTPWGRMSHAMIIKVAEANALRKAFNISGVYSSEEMAATLAQAAKDASVIQYGDDALGAWLRELVAAVRRVRNGVLGPTDAKLRLMLNDASDEQREEFAAELVAKLQKHGVEVPERVMEAVAVEVDDDDDGGETITDAEVVGDDVQTGLDPDPGVNGHDTDDGAEPPEGWQPSTEPPDDGIEFGDPDDRSPGEGQESLPGAEG
jgi:phage recombination protein Bet